jgi:hypothetical protein
MRRPVLTFLLGLLICAVLVSCLIYSSICFSWEAGNLDGSSSITWRSGALLVLLAGAGQLISSWTVRRRVASEVFIGLAASIAIAVWILNCGFSFSWETRGIGGTFSLTWRSDVVVFLVLSIPQCLSFIVSRYVRMHNRNRHSVQAAAPPNI